MLKSVNHIRIITGCITIFFCMLTASFVFAKGEEIVTKKSYYIPPTSENEYTEKSLDLVNTLKKDVSNDSASKTYELEVIDGNVIQVDSNGRTKSVYSRGNAKFLSEVNYYYYDASYILIVTSDGSLYANVYKTNEDQTRFVKINTGFEINELKVIERDLKFYEYPDVSLYGLDEDGNWKIIKL